MDGKKRGGKRLARRGRRACPMGWAVVLSVALALCYTVFLFTEGSREAREAAQDGAQAGEGVQVISWTPEDFVGLYAPTEPPAASVEAAAPWSDDDLELLAQTIWAEANVCRTTKERAAVVWCVLNRLDTGIWGDTIREVVTYKNQFAWTEDRPVLPGYVELAEDVLLRWMAEKAGEEDVGRVLPAEYLYFEGDGLENHFRIEYRDTKAEWTWTLPDPYGEG